MTNQELTEQTSSNELQERSKILKTLGILAATKEATGKLKPGTSELMITSLMEDLARFKTRDVLMAIEQHKQTSSWWPEIADLLKFIKPEIASRERQKDWIADERRIMNFMLEGRNEEDTARITEAFKERGVEAEKHIAPQLGGQSFQIPKLKEM